MKKLSILAIAVLLVCIIAVPVFAAQTASISVTASSNTVSRGDTVTVTISTSEVVNCTAGGFMLDFNADAFEYISGTALISGFNAGVDIVNDIVSCYFMNGNATLQGDLFQITLKVKDAAAYGEYTISGTPSIVTNLNGVDEEVTCTTSNATITVACKHTWVKGETVAPVVGAQGYTNYSCSSCGETKKDDFVAALPAGSVVIAGKTLSYQDTICMKFAFGITGDATERKVYLYSTLADAEARTNPTEVHDLFVNGSTYQAYSDGIPARKMGDSVYIVGYAKFTDGSCAYSEILEYSPLIYAKNMIAKESSKAETKALCKALLHYGAAAQVYIDKKTEGLMNEGIEAVPFDESVLGESIFSAQKGVYENGMAYAGANMSFAGAISYKFAFTLDAERASKDVYLEYSIGGRSVQSVQLFANGNTYQCEIAGNPARTMGDEVVARPYYLDEAGNKVYGLEIHYSGYEYARNKMGSNTDGAKLALAFAMYVHAAKVAIG